MNANIYHIPENIPQQIFRAYDVRGIVGETLDTHTVYALGRVLGTKARNAGETSIIAARDGRLSSPALFEALLVGLTQSGIDVIDIGAVPTPLLYFATHTLGAKSGVIVTGSHNPMNHNGLKIVLQGKTLADNEIHSLSDAIKQQKFSEGTGQVTNENVIDAYIQRVTSEFSLKRKLKIVIDCGNGITANVAPQLFKALGCDVIALFCDVDGHFPNHHPDPCVPENLRDLREAVLTHHADLGFAFDGDGDRLGVVSNEGEIIWPDRQMMLFSKSILALNTGARVIFDIKCSRHLPAMIEQCGGIAQMTQTGHSIIKNEMEACGAVLAGEMSGHIFFNDRWYGFDDGMYAAARLLEIIAGTEQSATRRFMDLPDSVNTPELTIPTTDEYKFEFIEKLRDAADFGDANIINIDGLRVEFSACWGLIRASNTTSKLVLRFEADDDAGMERIQALFKREILKVDAGLTLPY